MRSLQCDQCEVSYQAADFDGWFTQMMGHYMETHADVMKANEGKTKEDGQKWMADMKAKFEEQPEA